MSIFVPWRLKFVSRWWTIVSYFKNNKPGNCHYTPPCYFFSDKLRTNPENYTWLFS